MSEPSPKGQYFVVVKGDWKDKTRFKDLSLAERFATDMAKRGCPSEIIVVLARFEHFYSVERIDYGE